MWNYNSEDFDPAAPVIEVEVVFENVANHIIQMQVDSGADLSCVPAKIVPPSGDLPYSYSYIVGYDGVKVARKIYHVTCRVGSQLFEGIEVLPIEGELGLVGRDVLNSLCLTLNGPELQLLIRDE